MEAATYSAPGKVILCGEHFVVYGSKAIAGAIHLRAYARAIRRDDGVLTITSKDMKISAEWLGDRLLSESQSGASRRLNPLRELASRILNKRPASGLSLDISSEIPRGAGLGSSASVSVSSAAACAHVLGAPMSVPDIIDLASVAEGIVHYRASGIDLAVAAHGGLLSYKRGSEPERLRIRDPLHFLLIDTGVPRRTGEMVKRVSMLRERYPSLFDKLQEAVDELVEQARDAAMEGDLEKLGDLMRINHSLLKAIGVSTKELDLAVESAIRAGALGAKLTGGGGGGFVIALVREGESAEISSRLSSRFKVYQTIVPQEGVRLERV